MSAACASNSGPSERQVIEPPRVEVSRLGLAKPTCASEPTCAQLKLALPRPISQSSAVCIITQDKEKESLEKLHGSQRSHASKPFSGARALPPALPFCAHERRRSVAPALSCCAVGLVLYWRLSGTGSSGHSRERVRHQIEPPPVAREIDDESAPGRQAANREAVRSLFVARA